MPRNAQIDWGLLFSATKDNAMFFFQLLGMGLCFSSVGVFLLITDEGYRDLGQLFGGGLFGLIGVALVVAAFMCSFSSVSYYYSQALLRKHGVAITAELTKKEAQCQFHQEYDRNNRPLGEGIYLCDLYLEFEFQFNGKVQNGAAFIRKAELFDKLREGDKIPLMVLRFDPTVNKVRERKLSNSFKTRAPEKPSQIPERAEISF